MLNILSDKAREIRVLEFIMQGQEVIRDLADGEISLRDEFTSGHNFATKSGSISL